MANKSDAFQLSRRAVIAGGLGTCLPGAIRAELTPPSGAVGLVCSRRGLARLIFEGEAGATLSAAYRWHIGSNTKALTAALYARLVEKRRCRWGATIPSLFPDAAAHAAWADVRIEDLLSHAAGLTDAIVDSAWLNARHADRSTPRNQRASLIRNILASPPDGKLGIYRYGNLNYVMVGAAIEAATNMNWEAVMHAELFRPLAMRAAGFGAPPRTGPWGREQIGDTLKPIDPTGIADNPAILWPSGGVHLSPQCYAQFLQVFLRQGMPLLGRDTLRYLLTPAHPKLRYAGGWSLSGPIGSEADMLAHNGSNTLWFATAKIDRPKGRGYAAIVNRGGQPGEAVTTRLVNRLESAP